MIHASRIRKFYWISYLFSSSAYGQTDIFCCESCKIDGEFSMVWKIDLEKWKQFSDLFRIFSEEKKRKKRIKIRVEIGQIEG